MYSWTNSYEHVHAIMYKQKDQFPYPSSCTDAELLEFWNDTLDKYEHYNDIYERLDFESDADEEIFLKRIDYLEELLDDIDYEWERRPWLSGR